MRRISFCVLFFGSVLLQYVTAQTPQQDSLKVESLAEVFVQSVRVKPNAPIAHSNLKKDEIAKRNLGQDIATQLNLLPGVVTTSDAGAGIGYTGFRVRGTANQGINVTINGIPYNDSESATSFFVNLQDFSSSIEDLQLQRGVGTSTNGPGAFGASLNIQTESRSTQAFAEISNSFGSFNTRRHNLKFSTGLLSNFVTVSGRVSQIKSEGFLDRSASNLKSYFLQGTFKNKNTLIKLINFAGSEVTQQAWFGVDKETAINNPTFNPAGAYTGPNNEIRFHTNQVDNYKQDHFQLHWSQRYDNNWSTTLSLNYTYGRGFFEEYKEDEVLDFYGITGPVINEEQVLNSNLIRRRWLKNDYYVANATVNYRNTQWDFTGGLFYSTYDGDHFGEVIWAQFAGDAALGDRYYFGNGKKGDVSAFAKANFLLTNKWSLYGDLQLRFIDYKTTGQNSDVSDFLIDKSYSFFNPKAGVSYQLNREQQFYFSYAKAHREPNRTDFENGAPRPERLDDFELGWRLKQQKLLLNVNGYYMDYTDQLVLTGALDNSGAPVRTNSGSSYRLGVEVDASIQLGKKFRLMPNVAWSINRNRDFVFRRDGNFENLGNTQISYSPQVVAANTIAYAPNKQWYFGVLTKYVGAQFMSNIESAVSRLDAFATTDLNVVYILENIGVFKKLTISGLFNNVLNNKYISNGYFFTYDDDFSNPDVITTIEGVGFYPQAGFNFLLGCTARF